MSRYILTPSRIQSNDPSQEMFTLAPTEGFNNEPKTIELPKELVPKMHKHNESAEKLLSLISKTDIGRTKDGLIAIGNRVFDIDYDDFISDCCERQFKECYENIYCELRKNGITF